MIDVEVLLGKAVQQFWRTRSRQKVKQGLQSGRKDAGNRAAVTGGKHADGFVELVAAIVRDAGLPAARIHTKQKLRRTLPGHFRPTKEWDVVVVSDSNLVAVIEIKSQVGSFGNNFNNRVEEALGNAVDFWTAYRKGRFSPSQKPWLGYLFMLEEDPKSLRPTKRIELSPFQVDEAFQGLSYAQRYELVCERLVRELHYDAACLFTSSAKSGLKGIYHLPNEELDIRRFAISLHARAAAFAKLGR